MSLKDIILSGLIEKTPDVPVGYIASSPKFKEEIQEAVNDINGTFQEINPQEYRPNTHNRSVEYIFVENIGEIENGLSLAYNVLESVGLVIMIEKKPFDIWEISEKCQENFLSEATSIDIDEEFALITSKKLLRS